MASPVLQEKVSNFLGRWFVRDGAAVSIVKGTVLFEREGTHMCVFHVSCFLMLLPASLGLRHHLNYINVHNLKRYSEASIPISTADNHREWLFLFSHIHDNVFNLNINMKEKKASKTKENPHTLLAANLPRAQRSPS